MKLCVTAVVLILSATRANAQATPPDTAFHVGRCAAPDTSVALWSAVVDEPDEPARLVRTTVPKPPKAFSNLDGVFVGRVVIAVVVDTTGAVVPGTVAVAQSTEPRLSSWACKAALDLRFVPAKHEGKLVRALLQQPLTYALSPVAPPPTPIIRGRVVVTRP